MQTRINNGKLFWNLLAAGAQICDDSYCRGTVVYMKSTAFSVVIQREA
jgi:hypothetical protein